MGLSCLFGHKWNGCTCDKCGKARDRHHYFDLSNGKYKRCSKRQDKLARLSEIEQLTDQNELSRLVWENDDNDCALAALNRVTDYNELFHYLVKNSNYVVRNVNYKADSSRKCNTPGVG